MTNKYAYLDIYKQMSKISRVFHIRPYARNWWGTQTSHLVLRGSVSPAASK